MYMYIDVNVCLLLLVYASSMTAMNGGLTRWAAAERTLTRALNSLAITCTGVSSAMRNNVYLHLMFTYMYVHCQRFHFITAYTYTYMHMYIYSQSKLTFHLSCA